MKICIVQTDSKDDMNLNLDRIEKFILKASKNNADLIVFPELFLTGYLLTEEIKKEAITLKNSVIKSLQNMCKTNNIACVIGFPRKERNLIFNSACFIDKSGKLLSVYDKTHLFGDEKLYFSEGKELKVFETSLGKVGLLICYDIEFPEPSRTLAIKGAEIIVCISANMKPYYDLHKKFIEIRALENTTNLIYCNYVGSNKQFSFVGQSNIINNLGKNICNYSKRKKLIYGNLTSNNILDENMNYIRHLRQDIYN